MQLNELFQPFDFYQKERNNKSLRLSLKSECDNLYEEHKKFQLCA